MKITIEGYKAIAAKRSIELRGLTILAGANSSGKSSFMQPLLLIKQTLESDFDAGTFLLDGPNVRLTDSSEMVSRVPGQPNTGFSIGLQDRRDNTIASYRFDSGAGVLVDSQYMLGGFMPNGLSLKVNTPHEEICTAIEDSDLDWAIPITGNTRYTIKQRRCFLQLAAEGSRSMVGDDIISTAMMRLGGFAKNILHIPGLRGNPERAYRAAAATGNPSFPGSFEKYIASLIYHWQTDPEQHDKFAKLQDYLQQLGLASATEANRLNDSRLELRISRQIKSSIPAADLVNIADVGFGVSQVLPVLVALLTAKPEQLVYIEQPELHLHPRAQHALARVMADAITTRNINLVIETHSAILIRGVQTLVAQRKLAPDLVSLNWFTQNPDTGQADISSATLDEYGAFGDWPEDFDEVALDADRMYLDAVEQAMNHEV